MADKGMVDMAMAEDVMIDTAERDFGVTDDATLSTEAGMEPACCCSGKTKERSEKEVKDLINRLSRIEGQIRGIKRMVEEDAYCVDIITQVSATSCAMNSFAKELLARHIKGCVAEDIRDGSEEKVDELVKMLQRLMK